MKNPSIYNLHLEYSKCYIIFFFVYWLTW